MMIKKLSIENSMIFGNLELSFYSGLCVFSGPSGSGKSVLMESLLSAFGLKEPNASVIETDVILSQKLIEAFEEELGIEGELLNIKIMKKEKIRYFVNFAPIAKKHLSDMLTHYISYIHSRGGDELSDNALLDLLDSRIATQEHLSALKKLASNFHTLKESKAKLATILETEANLTNLQEIAEFEIQKIDAIAPKIGEYEQLLELKKSLSRKEKILESIAKATAIIDKSDAITQALSHIDKPLESSAFDQALRDAQALLEDERHKLESLDELEAEALLSRISDLSSLIHRYGSIESALEHREKQAQKLAEFSDFSAQKSALEQHISTIQARLDSSAKRVSERRIQELEAFTHAINELCAKLKLPEAQVSLLQKPLESNGTDRLSVRLNSSEISTLSAGEFNRLRLAVMCLGARAQKRQGVLILDEIDANLSGAESEGVASILHELSSSYQIFAISHQPHLPSIADYHFLVSKSDETSRVTLLDTNGRIHELARMISGSHITQEALEFARKTLESKRDSRFDFTLESQLDSKHAAQNTHATQG